MMDGSREKIFDDGEKSEDNANKKAQQNAKDHHAQYSKTNRDANIKRRPLWPYFRSSEVKHGARDIDPVSYTHLTLPTTPYV